MSSKKYDKAFERWRRAGVIDPAATYRAAALAVSTAEFVLERTIRTVVDVGCGEGLWRDAVRSVVGAHDALAARRLRYIAVDPSPHIFATQANVVRGGFGDLPFIAGHFGLASLDLLICNDVLPFVPASAIHCGLTWIAENLTGAAWLQAVTKSDAFEGDREEFIARDAGQYKVMFARHGLHRIGPHLYVHERTLTRLHALERPL